MTPVFLAYGSLALAIVCEVAGSAFLQKSEQFSRIGPVIAMTILYGIPKPSKAYRSGWLTPSGAASVSF